MTTLLAVCALLTSLLSAYALGHYLCGGVFVFGRRRARSFSETPKDSVAILVPAKNEGERALRAVQSLRRQDHQGPLEIYLLVKDATDSALPFLRALYPKADLQAGVGSVVELEQSGGRRVALAFTGADPKSEKVNWMVGRLGTDYVGILDADHQADPDWVRSSLVLLKEQGARIIQARRAPISARGFFALWDSLHQHIGCELFNTAFTRMGMTVYFTGTTALMETALLRDHPLSGCITEDIDFSYTIVLEGERILHNPYSGSSEETSPDLYSFLARRRRWSNGHTSTFLRHLGRSFTAPLSLRGRAQFLYHGAHYLVSVVVFVLHLAIGVVFIQSLSPMSRVAAVLASLGLGAAIARSQRTLGWGARILEVGVIFAWLFPAIVIAMNLAQAVIISDLSRAALQIPYAIQALGLFGLAAPLLLLLIGLAGFGQASVGTFLAVVLSYPAAFYLDISGVLLGMADCLSGRGRWRPVSRKAPAPAQLAEGPLTLLSPLSIKESMRFSALWPASGGMLPTLAVAMTKSSRLLLGASLVAIFGAGVFYGPSAQIEVAKGKCEALPHDGDPWIVPAKKLPGYCDTPGEDPVEQATRTGTFKLERQDEFAGIDPAFWDRLDTTFFCNLAVFSPDHAVATPGQGLRLQLNQGDNDKGYSSGSIATKTNHEAQYTYGRFETVLKAAKTSGVINAFFLYRFDPWQEIDAEILGKDPTKLLINVYYNPGQEGDLYNYGMLGTPVLVDLGFDASLDFHRYAIEWEAEEIRWFADDKLVHVRRDGRPTPIPHLPMRLHANLWPCCSEKLAGPFGPDSVPAAAELKSIAIYRWYPSPLPHFLSRFDSLFTSDEPKDWRKKAKWIQ